MPTRRGYARSGTHGRSYALSGTDTTGHPHCLVLMLRMRSYQVGGALCSYSSHLVACAEKGQVLCHAYLVLRSGSSPVCTGLLIGYGTMRPAVLMSCLGTIIAVVLSLGMVLCGWESRIYAGESPQMRCLVWY